MRRYLYITLTVFTGLAILMTACILAEEDIETLEKKATAANLGITVNIASIQGVTNPVIGEKLVSIITESEQYTGTVKWFTDDTGTVKWLTDDTTFSFGIKYTAKITLTPKSGFTLHLVKADFFTVAGAVSVSNGANSGVITAVFPAIDSKAAGAAVSVPTLGNRTTNSITINAISVPVTGQSVEYAINTSDIAPSAGWQADTTFNGLNAGTKYYIFARSASNNNYIAGTASLSLEVSTLQTVSMFEYYWVDQHDTLVTTSGGVISITTGSTLTITAAQGTDYVVKQWYVNGINTGQSGNTYYFSITTTGIHTVDLFLEKSGKLYNTSIVITVTP